MLETKLNPPQQSDPLIKRETLESQVLAGLTNRLTLVSAPAGFGKSTLVASVLNQSGLDYCWISLEKYDDSVPQLIKLICVAIKKTNPAFSNTCLAFLEETQSVNEDQIISSFITDIANSISSQMTIVLDDFHLIDNTQVDFALNNILEQLPGHVHFIIITREDPVMPLAKLRASGKLSEIRARDLRFSETEVSEYLNAMSLNIQEADSHLLAKKTEGWIVGLKLAAISIANSSNYSQFIKDFEGTHRYILDYLLEEVLDNLPSELTDFILQTSILERFNSELCDHLLARTGSQKIINTLESQNIFLIPLDDEREWYRYHHLFAHMLKKRLEVSRQNTKQLHLSACDYFLKINSYKEAVSHCVNTQDNDYLVNLLSEYWPQIKKEEPELLLINWLSEIPRESIQSSLTLSIYYAVALLSNDLLQAGEWLDWCDSQRTREDFPTELAGILSIGEAYAAAARGDFNSVVQNANKALCELRDEDIIWRGAAAVLLGIMQWQSGDLHAARALLLSARTDMRRANEPGSIIGTNYLLINVLIALGERREAKQICDKSIDYINTLNFIPEGTADIHVALAGLAFESLDLETMQKHLDIVSALPESAKLPESAHYYYIFSALKAAYSKDKQLAEDLLYEAMDVKIPSPAPDFTPIDAILTRIYLDFDRLEDAELCFSRCNLNTDEDVSYLREFEWLTFIRIVMKKNMADGQHALAVVEQPLLSLEQFAEEQSRITSWAEIKTLQTKLAYLNNDYPKVNQLFKELVNKVDTAAIKFMIENVLGSIKPALLEIIAEAALPDWFTESASVAKPSRIDTPQLIEPLSRREKEVLKQLATDLSGPEIADTLYISMNTLRTHLKNIYAKLGVNNRRAALRSVSMSGEI